jgi:hypothetical protein
MHLCETKYKMCVCSQLLLVKFTLLTITEDCTYFWCRLAKGKLAAEASFQEQAAEMWRTAEEQFQKVQYQPPSPLPFHPQRITPPENA